jgi:hypothetical protein
MASFPKLSTGALAQYGSAYELGFRTRVIRYVDGSEQRYADRGAALRSWIIALSQLTPIESAALKAFFREHRGREGTFSFTDPWTGIEYPACRFDRDAIALKAIDELSASATLVIREVKS